MWKGSLLSGLVQNASDCALKLLEAAGEDEKGENKLLPLPSSKTPEAAQMGHQQDTLTSSDDEFEDAVEGPESMPGLVFLLSYI